MTYFPNIGGGGGGATAQPLKTLQAVSYRPGDDGTRQAGLARSFVDNANGTVTESKSKLMWIKAPWLLTPGSTYAGARTPRGQYAWNTGYNVGDLVMAGNWWDEPGMLGWGPGTYAKGTKINNWDGSQTTYWESMVDGNTDSPYQWTHWQQLPMAPSGVRMCVTAHTSPAFTYFMWGMDGVAWSLNQMTYDGMYYYRCIQAYTQTAAADYPYNDPTHWQQVPGYAKTTLLADARWVPAPFYLTADDANLLRGFQLSTWLDFAATLTVAGFSDWRVPNANELLTLYDFGQMAFVNAVTATGYTVISSTPLGPAPFTTGSYLFTLGMGSMMYSNSLDGVNGMTYLVRDA